MMYRIRMTALVVGGSSPGSHAAYIRQFTAPAAAGEGWQPSAARRDLAGSSGCDGRAWDACPASGVLLAAGAFRRGGARRLLEDAGDGQTQAGQDGIAAQF